MAFPDHFYEEPRKALLPPRHQSNKDECHFQEKWMYPFWAHQRLKVDFLQTIDGTPIKVLHPGFSNLESGPDFKNAFIAIGDNPPRQCDVELDIDASNWQQHAHHLNPSFKHVALQVVWNKPKDFLSADGRAILHLREFLDSPLEELLEWENSDEANDIPDNTLGKCASFFQNFSETECNSLYKQAALIRIKSKSLSIAATARIYGWEQALLIHLLRGLGYKQNAWPMQKLGELMPSLNVPLENMQALLLGIAGIIPQKLSNSEKDSYILHLWSVWWRHQSKCTETIFPAGIWNLSGTRPSNHPQRRIALAAHWLIDSSLIQKIEGWALSDFLTKDSVEKLAKILSPQKKDDFWKYHYTLNSKRLEKPIPLLGEERVKDLFVNAIAPWFWARTKGNPTRKMENQILERYFQWPSSGDNAHLRLALDRFYGNCSPKRLKYAFQQQAVLQINADFCNKTNPCCHHCPLVDCWQALLKI